MQFFRMGPRYLYIQTSSKEAITEALTRMDGEVVPFFEGFRRAGGESTLCFLFGPEGADDYAEHTKKKSDEQADKNEGPKTQISNTQGPKTQLLEKARTPDRSGTKEVFSDLDDPTNPVIVIHKNSSKCLSGLINAGAAHHIAKAELGPGIIVMRFAGSDEEIYKGLSDFFKGTLLPLERVVSTCGSQETIIALTKNALNRPLKENEFLTQCLVVPSPVGEVQKKIRTDGLRLITQAQESGEWYELRISIFDSKGRFQIHYDRLSLVLGYLELGMILGENWSRDHALAMLTVMVYQIRLFTLSPPAEIKQVLLGLEYLDDGTRVADFDLYYRNKKISWVDVHYNNSSNGETDNLTPDNHSPPTLAKSLTSFIAKHWKKREKRDKKGEGRFYRHALLERLGPEEKAGLLDLEKKLSFEPPS